MSAFYHKVLIGQRREEGKTAWNKTVFDCEGVNDYTYQHGATAG
jgi:hypothetical protein